MVNIFRTRRSLLLVGALGAATLAAMSAWAGARSGHPKMATVLVEATESQQTTGSSSDVMEEWLDANTVRIHALGRTEEFALMPLASHLCKSGRTMFQRYCDETQR